MTASFRYVRLFKLKKGLFLTFRMGTSNARNKNLRPLFNTNIPPISGKYGLRNHFWSLESGFLMRKREENDFFSKSAKLPILSFWILNVHIIICQFQKRSTVIHFFSLSPCSCHQWLVFRHFQLPVHFIQYTCPLFVKTSSQHTFLSACLLAIMLLNDILSFVIVFLYL